MFSVSFASSRFIVSGIFSVGSEAGLCEPGLAASEAGILRGLDKKVQEGGLWLHAAGKRGAETVDCDDQGNR
jgi:hypothetical protein